MHAVITSEDGARIAFFADGLGIPVEGSPVMALRENVTLYTRAPEYVWVNRAQFWATGQVDLAAHKITLAGYQA